MPYSTHFLLHTSTYFTIPTPHIPLHRSSPTPHIPHSIFTNLTSPYSTHPSLHLHQPSLHPTPHIPHSIFTNPHFTLLHTFPTPYSPTFTSPYSTHSPLHFPLSCHTPKPTPKSLYSKPLKSPAPLRHTARAGALQIESYYPAGCCILVATERSPTRGSD